ncbi:Uncharacterized protein ABC855_g3474 [[Candida] zeylanoides]
MADSDPQQSDSSVSSFVTSLIFFLIIFVIYITVFIILRKRQRRVYEPRTEVKTLSSDIRPDENPKGVLTWLTHIMKKPDTFFIQHAGVDGYFFLRFIFEFGAICLLGCIILWPILFPLAAANSNGEDGFNILTFGNVRNKWRYFGHVFLSWVFFGCTIFVIYRELVYYTTFRHVLQTTPLYDSLLSSRTLLLTEVPSKTLEEAELRRFFPTATNIWYARDYAELNDKVKERAKLAGKYEGAVNKVLSKAVKLRNKCVKKNKPAPTPADDLNKYLKGGKKRPTHRLKFLIGKKVDTLDYGKERLGELNKEIKKDQLECHANTQIPSVFIEFPTQLELQKAYQAIPYNDEFKQTKRFTGYAPDDVIWENLALTKYKRKVKKILANTFLTLLIIFWAIPVAFVGAISHVDKLIELIPAFEFINNLPDVLMGLITGLLPVVALSVLMSLVPPIIKKMGKIAGCITVQHVESYCQAWFYAFQVVQVFLVVTLGSSASSVVNSIIDDPSSALQMLKDQIPPASNFYLSYLCFQGLGVSSGLLFQMVPLILAQFLGKILDSTPRSKWSRYNTLGQPGWSTTYPVNQLLAVIALCYSIIAPLILGFTFVTFVLIYFAWSYQLTYVLQPNKHDAKGRNFPSALFQMFVGIYLAEVCLIAMFVFSKNWACVALQAITIIGTAGAHIYFKMIFLPLFETVPISAIKYASGDTTFQYPMYDQGLKEIKIEGEHYWDGGNQLGLTGKLEHVLPQHVLPEQDQAREQQLMNSDDSVKQEVTSVADSRSPINHRDEKLPDSTVDRQPTENDHGKFASAKRPVSVVTRFFKPKQDTYDLLRAKMPAPFFNYIEYNDEFLRTAYEDPAVNDPEPHIWIAKDDLGLSEIEKNQALENGVDVSDENAIFNAKGSIEYIGAPPSYEEALKI